MATITDAHRVTERDLSLAVGDCPSSTAVRSGLSPEMCLLCVRGGLRDPRERGRLEDQLEACLLVWR